MIMCPVEGVVTCLLPFVQIEIWVGGEQKNDKEGQLATREEKDGKNHVAKEEEDK